MFYIEIIDAAIEGAVAVGLGVAMGWLIRGRIDEPVAAPDIDTQLDDEIQQAAREWAARNGRPEIAPLLARKVRLQWGIQYGDREESR